MTYIGSEHGGEIRQKAEEGPTQHQKRPIIKLSTFEVMREWFVGQAAHLASDSAAGPPKAGAMTAPLQM